MHLTIRYNGRSICYDPMDDDFFTWDDCEPDKLTRDQVIRFFEVFPLSSDDIMIVGGKNS